MPKITVYIPTHNYAKYIDQAIHSVLKQTMHDWELIIINDGSTDNTSEKLYKYKNHNKIKIIEQSKRGLNITNNIAIRLSCGQYIIRLDADDYFDENALHLLSNILDTKPEIGLVYPDYYEVDNTGEIIKLVRRSKIGSEVELLDLPAHGACTLFRKSCLVDIGGYSENYDCQDCYDVWLKFIKKFKPYNINIPLFYYRQHHGSLTRNQKKIYETRRLIKREFVKNNKSIRPLNILGVIPVIRRSTLAYSDPFHILAGKPLIWYTLNEAVKSKLLSRIVVSSDDDKVIKYTQSFNYITTIKRKQDLSTTTTQMYSIVNFVLDQLKKDYHYKPDAVCTLYINTPLRMAKHIDKAIDTLSIFDIDSVISVEEELALCHQHGKYGLVPIAKSRDLRIERKSIYKENGAIYLSKSSVIRSNKLVGEKLGHIIMLPEESVRINSEYSVWLAEMIIKKLKK